MAVYLDRLDLYDRSLHIQNRFWFIDFFDAELVLFDAFIYGGKGQETLSRLSLGYKWCLLWSMHENGSSLLSSKTDAGWPLKEPR